MRYDQTICDNGARIETVALLNTQLAAAAGILDQMLASSRNVVGDGFIMFDERCGQIALLMDGCCTRIAAQVQYLGGDADWPVQALRVKPPVMASTVTFDTSNDYAMDALQELGHSLRKAILVVGHQADQSSVAMLLRILRKVDRHLQRGMSAADL